MNIKNNSDVMAREAISEEQKDYTKWIWLGVILLLIVMMGFLYSERSNKPLATSVRARHILVSFDSSDPVERGRAYERIVELKKRLDAGESFERLATAHSDDSSSAKRGGDLGWAPRGTYAAAFDEYCWTGEIGKVSDIIQTNFGFHLILIEDRHIADADLYEKDLEQRALQEIKNGAAASTEQK